MHVFRQRFDRVEQNLRVDAAVGDVETELLRERFVLKRDNACDVEPLQRPEREHLVDTREHFGRELRVGEGSLGEARDFVGRQRVVGRDIADTPRRGIRRQHEDRVAGRNPRAVAHFVGSGTPAKQLPPILQSLGAAPLAQGLNDLLKEFQQKGLGETIKSWIETGTNKPVSVGQLEQALGEEKIAWLMKQTGMSREALLEGLSRELPPTVDQLTPDGRLPTEDETTRRIEALAPESRT
jgi:uncharacterized protein YidB (DUF937 family)